MKRIYISALFIIIAFVSASAELGFISAKTDLFVSLINQTDEHMKKENFSKAIELCNEMEEKWKDESEIIDMLLNHEHIDSVGVNFSKMRSHIENGNVDLYFSESISAKKELAYIKESECLKIENVL